MEKEFIPYELAVKLKELGFNETCIMSFNYIPRNGNVRLVYGTVINEYYIPAPLWQQAFDCFRENHNLHYGIRNDGTHNSWYLSRWGKRYETYLEARQACLQKLIEIVENN